MLFWTRSQFTVVPPGHGERCFKHRALSACNSNGALATSFGGALKFQRRFTLLESQPLRPSRRRDHRSPAPFQD
jgi:hypothetical protein